MYADRKLMPLSLVPYYGGKYNMAYLIADMLRYSEYGIDTYVEPFGGGARVLLNKPRHKEEWYGEITAGMNTLFRVLSNKENSRELINALLKMEISEEIFYECLIYKNYEEDIYLKFIVETIELYLSRLVKKAKIKTGLIGKFRAIVNMMNEYDNFLDILKQYPKEFGSVLHSKFYKIIEKLDNLKLSDYEEDIKIIKKYIYLVAQLYEEIYDCIYINDYSYIDPNSCINLNSKINLKALVKYEINDEESFKRVIHDLDYEWNVENKDKLYRDVIVGSCPTLMKIEDKCGDIKIAVATYIVYLMSRNAIGKEWKGERYLKRDNYEKRVLNLVEISQRLEGVNIFPQFPSEIFIENDSHPKEPKEEEFFKSLDWYNKFNKENVCMYLDPPYLQEKNNDNKDYNPGSVYKNGYTKNNHIKLLKMIRNMKCHIIISNYDDNEHLYEKYLVEGEGLEDEEKEKYKKYNKFKRMEVETVTSISSKVALKRTECLWYRYGLK